MDRFGPRLMGMSGAAMVGVGFLAMSRLDSFNVGPLHATAFAAFLILYVGWMSIGYSAGSTSRSTAVNAWFVSKRGRAFALYTLGAGASGGTVVLLGWLANDYGWRTAALAAGIGVLVLSVPLSMFLRRRPEDYGYLPDGADPAAQGEPGHSTRAARVTMPAREPDMTIRQVIVATSFWLMILGFAARNVASTSIVIHQIKYLTDVRDFSLIVASGILGAVVTISMAGRLTFGLAGDFVPKNYALAAGFLLQALGIWILSMADTIGMVWIFAVVYGVAMGDDPGVDGDNRRLLWQTSLRNHPRPRAILPCTRHVHRARFRRLDIRHHGRIRNRLQHVHGGADRRRGVHDVCPKATRTADKRTPFCRRENRHVTSRRTLVLARTFLRPGWAG